MISIREATESDINFIYATMLNGLYYGCPLYNKIEKKAFFSNYQKVINGILFKAPTRLTIACLTVDTDVVLGYALSCPDDGILHFIYVKREWRMQGIAKKLLEGCSELSSVTHITDLGDKLRIAKGLAYNPFLI